LRRPQRAGPTSSGQALCFHVPGWTRRA
jgi:hypothetical protein